MAIRQRGFITQQLKGHKFEVALQDTPEHIVQATLSGRMQKGRITLVAGDEVDIELSEYDLTAGRIVWRF